MLQYQMIPSASPRYHEFPFTNMVSTHFTHMLASCSESTGHYKIPVFAIINTNIFQPYWMCNCENKLFFQSETWNIVVHNGGQQMTSNLWNVLVSEKKLSMHKIKIYYHGKCTCAIFILSMWWIKKLNCSLHSLICFFDALQPVNKICLCALSME